MLALIDGDVLCYRVGYTTENDAEWIARARLREMIGGILKSVNTTDYKIFLSDSKNNFRVDLFPNYKANRIQPKPKHLPYLQNLIVDEWEAEVAWGQEADDALGIEQSKNQQFNCEWGFGLSCPKQEGGWYKGPPSAPEAYGNTIICSIDKDLLQIPGQHYNFVKEEMKFVTPEEGLFRFYEQILVGDSGDNITVAEGLSCKGIGPKKAYKLLEGCNSQNDYFESVKDAYLKGWGHKETPKCGFDRNGSHSEGRYVCECGEELFDDEEILQKLLTTGQLVKIRTKEQELWEFPVNSQVEQTQ